LKASQANNRNIEAVVESTPTSNQQPGGRWFKRDKRPLPTSVTREARSHNELGHRD